MKKLKLKYISGLQEEFVIKINNCSYFEKTLKNLNLTNSLRQLEQRILSIIPITCTELLDNLKILIKYSENEVKHSQINQKKQYSKHLIVFVYPQFYTMMSNCNQREGENLIRVMGHKSSIEIQTQIQLMDGTDELSFIFHSLGGVVARSTLYVCLGSPHIFLFVKQKSLVKTGLWLMNNFYSNQSMSEITVTRCFNAIEFISLSSINCIMFRFQKFILVSSTQDDFVAFEVARLEKSNRVPLDKQLDIQCYAQKLPECTRIDKNFMFIENDNNLDNFIGRTGHMNLVQNTSMIRMIVTQSKLLDQ